MRGHAPPVDFCNRYDPRARPRTTEPRMTSPAVARRCSRSHDRDLSIVALSCGWQRSPFGERGQSRCHGPGAPPRSACLGSASPYAIARARASPQPIRLGHLLSRLAACAGWSCLRRGGFLPVPPGTSAPGFDSLSRSPPPGDPLPCGRGFRGQGRLTRTPAKGNAIRCTRGAFHRRIAPAGARLALPKLSPACGVATPAPSSFLPPPGQIGRAHV